MEQYKSQKGGTVTSRSISKVNAVHLSSLLQASKNSWVLLATGTDNILDVIWKLLPTQFYDEYEYM